MGGGCEPAIGAAGVSESRSTFGLRPKGPVPVECKSRSTVLSVKAEIIRYAWPKIKVVFSIQRENNTGPPSLQDPSALTKTDSDRAWPILLAQHPVDLVVVEKGDPCLPKKSPQPEAWGASERVDLYRV